MMDLKVKVIQNGEEKNLDLVAEFQITEGNEVNDYVLLTENKVVEENLIKLITAEVEGNKLIRIESDSSWEAIKNFMRSVSAIANINVNFVNNVSNKTLVIDKQKLRILAVKEEVLKLFKDKYGSYISKIEKELKERKLEEENNKIVIPILENQNIGDVMSDIQDQDAQVNEVSSDDMSDIDDSEVVETKEDIAESAAIENNIDEVNDTEDEEIENGEETKIVEEKVPSQEDNKDTKSVLKSDIISAIDNFISNI